MDTRKLEDIGESGWHELLFSAVSGGGSSEIPVPVGDDAAVLEWKPSCSLVVTTDLHVAGTHFKTEWLGWRGLARRAVLAAASDITAMGGVPTFFLVSLGVPATIPVECLREFALSLATISREFQIPLLGGDTAGSQTIVVDVTVLGRVENRFLRKQTGARPGDSLWVTGTLGLMRAATYCMGHPSEENNLREFFWNPPARWKRLEVLFRKLRVRALTDLSDGLAVDLKKILFRDRLGADIHLDRLPVDSRILSLCERYSWIPWETAFAGGEDFELLVVEEGDHHSGETLDLEGLPLTRIGSVTGEGDPVRTFLDGKIHPVKSEPYEHFG